MLQGYLSIRITLKPNTREKRVRSGLVPWKGLMLCISMEITFVSVDV